MKKINKMFMGFLISLGMVYPLQTYAFTKEETIYAKLDEVGKPYQREITNHLLVGEEKEIQDETKLKNILNLNGNEKFSFNGSSLIWKGNGKDIFYKGDFKDELPIEIEVKYFLDDEEKSVQDMIGKKGKVKIVYHFTNSLKNIVNINGQKETLYTPFVVTLGTYFNGKTNKNVTITNGKVVNNGMSEFAISIASPGLSDSISYDGFKGLDDITLTYETTKFSLNNVYILATPKLLEKEDFMIFKKMDQLYSNIEELQSNMDKIENGVQSLEVGAKSLKEGSYTLSLELGRAKEAITVLKNGSITLENGISELRNALKSVEANLNTSNINTYIQKLTYLQSQNTKALNQIIYASKKTKEELQGLYENNGLSEYQGADETLLSIKNNYEMILLLEGNNAAINGTLEMINDLQKQISTIMGTLDSAITKIYEGSHTLSNGLYTLELGVSKLYEGSSSLHQGAAILYDGTLTLKEGTRSFNQNGIQKLSTYSHTMKKYSDKVEALTELSKNYHGFSSSNIDKTTFIFKVNAVSGNY